MHVKLEIGAVSVFIFSVTDSISIDWNLTCFSGFLTRRPFPYKSKGIKYSKTEKAFFLERLLLRRAGKSFSITVEHRTADSVPTTIKSKVFIHDYFFFERLLITIFGLSISLIVDDALHISKNRKIQFLGEIVLSGRNQIFDHD